ncbi:hypothetical protein [[Phormidium] sp. ETS-05]|uniref:hypothetical protein n=1 Tax=[Phormidium] sp. ETS-05 TaxID=222819 RepID=UPI0018EED875|nr:hypothetical protein [[Phormidium] sp. ETS-05]
MTSLQSNKMDSTNRLKLQSILVALVQLPEGETVPKLSSDLLSNPHGVIVSLQKTGGYDSFLQLYDNAHDYFLAHYTVQEKNKIVLPKGNAADASAETAGEPDNKAISAPSEAEMSQWDVNKMLVDDDPVAAARANYEAISRYDIDVYSWADYSCRSC